MSAPMQIQCYKLCVETHNFYNINTTFFISNFILCFHVPVIYFSVSKFPFSFFKAKKGKTDETRRKVNIILLSGQRLELTCDNKSTCKDVFDMVVAHIGLVEHHLFALAMLKGECTVWPDCHSCVSLQSRTWKHLLNWKDFGSSELPFIYVLKMVLLKGVHYLEVEEMPTTIYFKKCPLSPPTIQSNLHIKRYGLVT